MRERCFGFKVGKRGDGDDFDDEREREGIGERVGVGVVVAGVVET